MGYGIALHTIIPVRTEPREGAEQNTQMLFGELCTIIEERPKWNYIRLENDGQEGWVDAKMITPMSDDEYMRYTKACKAAGMVVFPMAYAMSENNGQTIPLTASTRLPDYHEGRFEVLGVGFRIDPSMVITQPMELNQNNLMQTVRFFLNVPYLWGGKNALGMDCSGFTQTVMRLFGKELFRNASEQAMQGQPVAALSEAQAGDLIFFVHSPLTDTSQPITHVGLVIDTERVIHCSGRVKVEKLDKTGIFNAEKGEYSHYLVQIRRV